MITTMKAFLLLCLIGIANFAVGQSKADSIKIEELYQASKAALNNDVHSARPIINEGLQFCQKKKYQKKELEFRNVLGTFFMYTSQKDSAVSTFRDGLRSATAMEYYELQSKFLNNLGYVKRYNQELDSAVYFYEQDMKIGRKLKNHKSIAESLINISDVYNNQAKYPQSIQVLQKSLRIIDSHDFDTSNYLLGCISVNLGASFFSIDDYEKALAYFRDAYSICSKNGDSRNLIISLVNIIHLLELKGDLQEIESMLSEIDQKAIEVGHSELFIMAKVARANYEYERGHFILAKQLATEGIELTRKFNTSRWTPSLYGILGKSSHELGDNSQSIVHLQHAIELGKSQGKKRFVTHTLITLAEYYEKTGKVADALRSLKESIAIKEELISESKKKTMQRLEVAYQTELLKKDNEIQRNTLISKNKELESKEQLSLRNMWLAILGFSIAFMVLILLFWIVKNRKLIQQKNALLDLKVTELMHTQNQLKQFQNKVRKQLERTIRVSTIRKNIKDPEEKSKTEYIALKEIIKITRGKGEPVNGVGEGSLRLDVYRGSGFKMKYSMALSSFMEEFSLNELDFIKIDSGTILNMHYIEQVDKENGQVHLRTQKFNAEKRIYEPIFEVFSLKPRSKNFEGFVTSYKIYQNMHSKLST